MSSWSDVAGALGPIPPGIGTLLIFLGFLLNLLSASVSALEYDLPEESPAGTVVGNVKRDSNLTLRYSADDANLLRFQVRSTVPTQPRYFALDERTGTITVTQVLNRETLCPYSLTCDLPFDVSVRPVQFYQVIKVVVHVVDINDNRPTFPADSVVLRVPETAAPGAMFMVPAAEDADSGTFGVQEYRLESDFETLFQVVATDQFDGAKDVRLKLGGRLDREQLDRYRLTVVAVDGGQQPRSGSIVVDVEVLDSNDNSPRFDNSTYEVEIVEDLPATSTLLRVHATDADQGPNGELRYSLADQTEALYGRIFGVDENTGYVFLKDSVDFEQHRSFHLTVQAADGGSGSLSAFAKIVVNVVDVNDNPPNITVNTLTDSSFARVRENSAPGTFVAHAALKDPDSGRNGQTQCFIDNREFFALESLYGSEYALTTTVPLDREERSGYEIVLTCRDRGYPPLTSSRTIQVRVTDENDNEPELNLPSNPFEVKIYENTPPNASVLRINASDRDEGPNGLLAYHLVPLDGTPEAVFSIDPATGIVMALRSLDYEQRTGYRFLLNVSDAGAEPQSTAATLVISLLDVNDERPVFDRSRYFLTVPENQPPGTVVGTVNATDRDRSADYRRVTYAFGVPSGVFDLDEQTGVVTTLRRLDREERETYRLSVTASNRGFPGMESQVNVTIFIEDENDSPPMFLFPGGGIDTVELPGHSAVPGTSVTRLSAIDRDFGRNGQLVYDINSGNVDDLFHIDPTTGVITLAKRPSSVLPPHGDHHHQRMQRHKLVVIARDGGTPPLICVADLTVVFNNSLMAVQAVQGDGGRDQEGFLRLLLEGNNVVILIGAVVGFVIVVTSVIVTAVCVRRHRRRRRKAARMSRDEGAEISHHHCRSPTFSTRGRRGGGGGVDRFGSLASSSVAAESASIQRSVTVACGLLPHHICDCDDAVTVTEDGATFTGRLQHDWPGHQQDSGIIAHSDGIPVTCGSGDALPHPLTPSSPSSFRCHGLPRTRSCSPHACCAHRCCSHGNRCGGGVAGVGGGGVPLSGDRCRLHQSPSFRRHPSLAVGPHSPSEAVRMLQRSVCHQEVISCCDHDLESLESESTWTDSGRGPSEEEDRLRAGQGQGPCLNCGSTGFAQTGDAVAAIS